MRAARSARCRSIAIARMNSGSASIHSIATEPEPAPMSHSSSPRRGASDDSVTARTSRLVIWPSCSNRSSASPDVRAMMRAPGAASTSIATVLSASTVPRSKPAAVVVRIRSRGPPSASSTVSREAPKPMLVRSCRQRGGARRRRRSAPGMRAPGCRCGRIRSRVRPWTESSAVVRQRPAEPRRGEAESRGRRHDEHLARDRCGARAWRRRHRWNGSPEASTHTWRPRWLRTSSAGAVERARPGPRRAANQRRRKAKMPSAADRRSPPRR